MLAIAKMILFTTGYGKCMDVAYYIKILMSQKKHFPYYNNGTRSPLLNDDCDWELLACSAAELSPINAVDVVEPCNDERPALLGRGRSLSKLTWPGVEADEPVEPRNPRKTINLPNLILPSCYYTFPHR